MTLTPSYYYKKDGGREINGYKIGLTKSLTEEAGFSAGDEVDVNYEKGKITITAKEITPKLR